MKSLLILGSIAALVSFAPAASAKTPAEIEQIANAVSVEILGGVGSGVIIHRQGNLYTVVTNRHVICRDDVSRERKPFCNESQIRDSDRLKTANGQVYPFYKSDIKLLKDAAGNNLDLAIIQFRSNKSYQVAQVAEPGSLKVDDEVYTVGFPERRGWLFSSGQALAVVNKRLLGDKGGYTVVYNAETLYGMSGGGAFDKNGRLVAVHGLGDRYRENSEARVGPSNIVKNEVGSKIGSNRGIPIRWVVSGLGRQGIFLGGVRSAQLTNEENAATATTADEFFIVGFNKLIEPGEDFQ
jgi:V8-like Glu-specific endopeptidase